MIPPVQYFAITDENDVVTHLGRVIRDETGLWSQMLQDGKWVENRVVLECLFDPLFGEPIDSEAAQRLAESFGGSLE